MPQDTTRGAPRQRDGGERLGEPLFVDHEQPLETRRGEQRADRRRDANQPHGEPAVEGALPNRDEESETAGVQLRGRTHVERYLDAPLTHRAVDGGVGVLAELRTPPVARRRHEALGERDAEVGRGDGGRMLRRGLLAVVAGVAILV